MRMHTDLHGLHQLRHLPAVWESRVDVCKVDLDDEVDVANARVQRRVRAHHTLPSAALELEEHVLADRQPKDVGLAREGEAEVARVVRDVDALL